MHPVLLLLLLLAAGVNGDWWKPPAGLTEWQYQLSDEGSIPVVLGVQVYVIDLDTARTALPLLKAAVPGVRVVCYFSAGTYESERAGWDSQRGRFSIGQRVWRGVRGRADPDWPLERWLDIRSPKVRRVMRRRMRFAAQLGCDGIDPDNVSGYTADSGFPLTKPDQISYIKWLAATAHSLGLACGLKNVPELVGDLKDDVDFAIVESCFTFQECGGYDVLAGAKPVWGVQYCDAAEYFGGEYATSDPACYCPRALAKGWSFSIKQVELGSWGVSCAAYCAARPGGCPNSGAGSCDAGAANICSSIQG